MLNMTVIGNLGTDPQTKQTTNGKQFCYFSVAHNKYMGKDKEPETVWVNVTVFDEFKAKIIAEHVRKGDKIYLKGDPEADSYEKNGETRVSLKLIVGFNSEMELLGKAEGRANTSSNAGGGSDDYADEPIDDDIPF